MATKYDRVASDLRRRIGTGELATGAQLPVETTLSADYRVSLITMRRALDRLAAEGLIEKRHGVGTFVRRPRQRVRRTTDRYQWEKDRVHLSDDERRQAGATEQDTGLSLEDLEFRAEYANVEADEALAAAFDVPMGTQLLERVVKVRSRTEHAPFNLGRSYLVYEMIKGNPDLLDSSNEPWPGGTHHQLSTVGIEIDRVIDEVTARPPYAEEAEELDISTGVAVLVLRKTSVDTNGRVVEVADAVYPGDRTAMVYTTQLKRWR